jgi:tetratricopeptide (TPR) repeat protein
MKKLMLIIIFILMLNSIYGGEKQKAADAFKNRDVKKAISIMKQYSKENPEDAEAYFYLGRYLHYAQYDVGKRVYDEKISNKIINYLDKAVSITDTIGNAYYYIGVEYGMRGHYAFIENDTIKSKKEFEIGRKKGGYPDWLLYYLREEMQKQIRYGISNL